MMTENRNIDSLQNLLDYEVSKFTSAEEQLKRGLQEWIEKVHSEKLKNVLQKYLEQVKEHGRKIDEFLRNEKINSVSLHNRIIEAYLEETTEKLSSCRDTDVKDACLLACIQAINHFKISAYGTAAAYANVLKMENQAVIFHELEVNEKQIDDRLSQLAEHEINLKANTPNELLGP